MEIHSCSYFCDRPECIKTQRDELRAKVELQSKIIADLTFNQRLQDAATAAVQERAEKAEAKLTEITELKHDISSALEANTALLKENEELRAKLAELAK